MKRDIRIDALRSLAIILIILAHVSPPTFIVQMRVFDVPLMTMLLGMSFVLSYKNEPYSKYIIKRFKRLIIPAWVFLTVFFIIMPLFFILFNISMPYSIGTLITSYSLLSGIGYVWIIRVFFTIAILAPLLLKVSNLVSNLKIKLICILFLLGFQEFLCMISEDLNGKLQFLFDQLIVISFGYSIVALVGMWVIKQTKVENLYLGCFSLLLFIINGLIRGFTLISKQKYPPTMYFITFGISISLILLYLISNEYMKKVLTINPIIWLLSRAV